MTTRIVSIQPAEPKQEPTRVALDQAVPADQQPPATKRIVQPSVPSAGPPSIQLKRPPTAPITIPPDLKAPTTSTIIKAPALGITLPTSIGSGDRKRTTRLILDAKTKLVQQVDKQTTSPITVIPQTVRLKRPGGAPGSITPPLKAGTDMIHAAPIVIRTPSPAPSSTSRILVEEIKETPQPTVIVKRSTSPITTAPAPAQPKPRTIRLKRSATVALEEEIATPPTDATPTVRKVNKAETAKIELPKEAEPIPMTQRKTIKIKRADRKEIPRTVTLKQPPAATARKLEPATSTASQALTESEPDQWSPLFLGLAAAAMLLIGCLVYFMLAQSFGSQPVLPVPAALL